MSFYQTPALRRIVRKLAATFVKSNSEPGRNKRRNCNVISSPVKTRPENETLYLMIRKEQVRPENWQMAHSLVCYSPNKCLHTSFRVKRKCDFYSGLQMSLYSLQTANFGRREPVIQVLKSWSKVGEIARWEHLLWRRRYP